MNRFEKYIGPIERLSFILMILNAGRGSESLMMKLSGSAIGRPSGCNAMYRVYVGCCRSGAVVALMKNRMDGQQRN